MSRYSNDSEEMSEESSEESTGRSRNHHIFQRLEVEEDESTEGEESDTNSYTSEDESDDDATFSSKDMLECNFCYKSLRFVVFEVFFFLISSGFCLEIVGLLHIIVKLN